MQENDRPQDCPRLPAAAAELGSRLPVKLLRPIAEPLLARVFAEALKNGELQLLETRELVLDIQDAGLALGFRVRDGGLKIGLPHSADVTIAGPMAAFIWLASRHADADTLFFHRHLTMEGDTELGLLVKNVVDATDLSKLPFAMRKSLSWLAALVPAQAPGTSLTRMPGPPNQ